MPAWLRQAPGRAVRAAIGYALPPRCPGCGTIVAADHSFCLPCWQGVDFLRGPACIVCAEPLEVAPHVETRCGACLADPPPYDRLAAAVAYGPTARTLALKLKHGGRAGLALTMARLMAECVGMLDAQAWVMPVPLHRWRLLRRGYNQSALIARGLVRRSGGTLVLDALSRSRATPPLKGLGRAARRRAIAGVFALDPARADEVRGRRIVLVDDVFTTGATAAGCARLLKKAGAAHVTVACWARVTEPGGGLRE